MSSKQERNNIHLPVDRVVVQTPDLWSKEVMLGQKEKKIDRIYESLKGKAKWNICSLPRATCMTSNYRSMRERTEVRFGRKDPLSLS